MSDAAELLTRLVSIPSPSGQEAGAVACLAELLEGHGAEPHVSGRNVWASRGEGEPALLLTSHVDTVPPASGWSRGPFEAVREGGRLYGLGAGDAKSAVIGLLLAFVEADVPGRLIFAATCDEETGGEGLEKLVGELPGFDAAVVGEPTAMHVCAAQKGLLKVRVRVAGRAGHASRPHEGLNAIYLACEAVSALRELELPRVHPILGRATVSVTLISGGVRSNVIPPDCSFTVDCRTTPEHPNEDVLERIRGAVHGELEVLSSRFQPVETDAASPIVRAALRALPGSELRAFGGVSDLFHLRHRPGILLGPGCPTQSHQADESIDLEAFRSGVAGYRKVVEEYFREVMSDE